MNKPSRPYEDAAELRTNLTGWCCKHCNRYWGHDAHMARWCCSTDRPCSGKGCSGRCERTSSTLCVDCHEKVRSKIWDAKPKVPWDGETPLCEWDGDRYFFDADAVADYIGDFLDDGGSVEDIRLVLARKMEPREFCMEDWCDDYTGEDGPDFPDTTEINKAVNDWIKANLNYLWEPSSQAVDPHSLPVPELSDIEVIDSTPLEREESA